MGSLLTGTDSVDGIESFTSISEVWVWSCPGRNSGRSGGLLSFSA